MRDTLLTRTEMADFIKEIGHLNYGSPARTRTTDKVVNSHLLYRLSYWGMYGALLSVLQSESVYTTASKSVSSFLRSFFLRTGDINTSLILAALPSNQLYPLNASPRVIWAANRRNAGTRVSLLSCQ